MFKKLYSYQLTVISLILFFLFTVTCTLSTVYAADEFATTYDVVYDVSDTGITTVTEKITLKNLTSQYYASQFKLIIGATDIFDIKASDSSGVIETTAEKQGNSTVINVKFNQQVTGLGKSLPWTLQFKSKDFAEKIGKVWEVRAPKISSSTNLESYNLTISVPQAFGEPTLISPTPKSQTSNAGKMFLTFEKGQLLNSGVSANFGTNQLFDFDLAFHLENKNLFPILTNIALPPDTNFQDVIFQRIDPKPLNVTVDEDGNYLAWYKLGRNDKVDVKVIGSAKLYTNSKVKEPKLDEGLRQKYLQANKYWEADNPQIIAKLEEILGVVTDPNEKVKLIYQFVVNSLKYDSGRLGDNTERLGAVTALNNPSSVVCMEFTDLFIALARAGGIPARELDGYAYTANPNLRPVSLNKDVLHAWPEYWDEKKGWVMVDPTWENTTGGVDYFNKLDLNHLTFVIKGASSSQPVPAGSYKFQGVDSHDVKVNLSENDFLGKPQLDVSFEVSDPILAGLPGKLKVKISNMGNALYFSDNFVLSSNNLNIIDGQNKALGAIPSFGTATFDFNFRTKSLFDSYTDTVTVLIGGQKFTKEVVVKPFFGFQTAPLVIGVIVLLMILVYGFVLGGLIYRKRISVIRHQSLDKKSKS